MTSIEWLISQLNKKGFAQVVTDEEIQQAKEIEKRQIIKSFEEGTKMNDIQDELSAGFNAVMYYYETYTND
jgi:hypothetical protein